MGALFEMKRPAVLFKGKRYRLDLAYDVVLLVQKLYEEEDLDNEDKINQALKLLVRSRFRVWLLNDLERAKLLEQITREHISSKRRTRMRFTPFMRMPAGCFTTQTGKRAG